VADFGFDGNVAILVGAARGIGYATAALFAEEGARITLADIDGQAVEAAAERLRSEHGAEAIGIQTDVTRPEAVAQMLTQTEAALGPPEIVVNSAAVLDDKRFQDSRPEDWQRMIDTCLYGPMHVIRAVLPGMTARQYGRIVCLASDAARIGQARLSYYAAAKAGVVALVKSVAQEVGASGVTLNVVSPGATNTELRQEREAGLRQEMGEERYARREAAVLRMYPTRRLGEPQDIAAAIAFLASRQASWVTGQVLSVNGGFVMP
jgi:NAD(P)-dependent dehydrogenase (short-subunit alcohol dehydrogenase family)